MLHEETTMLLYRYIRYNLQNEIFVPLICELLLRNQSVLRYVKCSIVTKTELPCFFMIIHIYIYTHKRE